MRMRLSYSFLLTFVFALAPIARADVFQIDGTQPFGWPASVQFEAPCGIVMNRPDDPFYWDPPVAAQFQDPNTIDPKNLCGNALATLTGGDSGGVNPKFSTMPDGSALPPTTTVAGGGVNAPQDPLDAPTTIVAYSPSATVEFIVSMGFRDTTDTKFEGKTDAVLEIPYDTRICADASTTTTELDKRIGASIVFVAQFLHSHHANNVSGRLETRARNRVGADCNWLSHGVWSK